MFVHLDGPPGLIASALVEGRHAALGVQLQFGGTGLGRQNLGGSQDLRAQTALATVGKHRQAPEHPAPRDVLDIRLQKAGNTRAQPTRAPDSS